MLCKECNEDILLGEAHITINGELRSYYYHIECYYAYEAQVQMILTLQELVTEEWHF